MVKKPEIVPSYGLLYWSPDRQCQGRVWTTFSCSGSFLLSPAEIWMPPAVSLKLPHTSKKVLCSHRASVGLSECACVCWGMGAPQNSITLLSGSCSGWGAGTQHCSISSYSSLACGVLLSQLLSGHVGGWAPDLCSTLFSSSRPWEPTYPGLVVRTNFDRKLRTSAQRLKYRGQSWQLWLTCWHV